MAIFGYSKTMSKLTNNLTGVSKSISCIAISIAIAFPAYAQTSPDRVAVSLSDPSQPARIKVSLLNGGITVKAAGGKEVIVEARAKNNRDSGGGEAGLRRIPMSATGLTVEEENNQVQVSADSTQRPIDLTISVPTR